MCILFPTYTHKSKSYDQIMMVEHRFDNTMSCSDAHSILIVVLQSALNSVIAELI
jgi:hypothetical protein